MSIQRIVQTFIRDKNNHVVVWQYPNPPIIGWFVCVVAAHFFHEGSLHTGFASLGSALLLVWAYLEITQGASYFRRALGCAVAIAIVVHYFS